jgi:MFS family permease
VNANDRAITSLVMAAHAMVHTYELAVPIFLPIWLGEFAAFDLGIVEVGMTEATLGAMLTLAYGLFGAGALPAGVLVDRFGSRRLITGCLVGMGGAYALLGLAPNALAVGAALVVWGVAASVYHPAGLALISKGVEERGTGFAYHGMAGNLGIALGPLVTALLPLAVDWGTVALVLALPALVAAAYAARADFDETAAVDAREDTAADGGRADGVDSLEEFLGESRRLLASGFALVFVVVMCSGLYYRGVLTFLPELVAGLPGFEPVSFADLLPAGARDALGVAAGDGRTLNPERYFYAGLLTVGVVGQYLGGKLTDRVHLEYGLAGAFGALAALAVLFLPVAALGVGPLVALGAVLGVALFVVQPMYQATVAEYTPAGTRGLSYGYTYLGVFGVGALGATVAGGLLTFASAGALFATLAGVAVVAASVAFYLARN